MRHYSTIFRPVTPEVEAKWRACQMPLPLSLSLSLYNSFRFTLFFFPSFFFFLILVMSFLHNLAHKVHDVGDKLHEKVHEFFHEEATTEEEKREEEYQAKLHRYGSFAPVRHGAEVKYFVDGHDYCWYVSLLFRVVPVAEFRFAQGRFRSHRARQARHFHRGLVAGKLLPIMLYSM